MFEGLTSTSTATSHTDSDNDSSGSVGLGKNVWTTTIQSPQKFIADSILGMIKVPQKRPPPDNRRGGGNKIAVQMVD